MNGKNPIQKNLDETFNNCKNDLAKLNQEISFLQTQCLNAVVNKLEIKPIVENIDYLNKNFNKVKRALNGIRQMFKT